MADKLFELIKSLSQAEKGYIRKQKKSFKKEHPYYFILFDRIEKQKKYDETELLRQVKEDGLRENLAVHKNHLYYFVLRCLQGFYGNQRKEIFDLCDQALILMKKRLITQAEKLLTRAARQALETENLDLFIDAKIELAGIGIRYNDKVFIENYEKIREELSSVSTHYQQYIQDFLYFLECRRELFNYLKTKDSKSQLFLEMALKQFIERSKTNSFPLKAKKLRLQGASMIASTLYKMEAKAEAEERMIKLVESNRTVFPGSSLLVGYFNYAMACLHSDQPKKALLYTRKIEGFKPATPIHHFERKYLLFYISVCIAFYTDNYRLLSRHEHILEEIIAYSSDGFDITGLNSVLLNLINVYIKKKEYQNARDIVAYLLIREKKQLSISKQMLVLFLEIIVLFELSEYEVVEYKIRNIQRLTAFRTGSFSLEKKVLTLIKELMDTGSNRKLRQNRVRLFSEDNTIDFDYTEAKFSDKVIHDWLQHKLKE